jgi:hypothetical protein
MRIMGILDPCGPHKGYQRILGIYTKYLQSGINYYNKNNLQSATLRGYVTVVIMLFEIRNYRPPINFNKTTKIIWLGSSLITLSKKGTLQSSVLPSTVPSSPKYRNRHENLTSQTQTIAFLPI